MHSGAATSQQRKFEGWTQIGSSWGWVLMESKEMMFLAEDRREAVPHVARKDPDYWLRTQLLCSEPSIQTFWSDPLSLFLLFSLLSLPSHGNFSGFLQWGQ